jgi:hypothetical protein
MQTAFFDYVQTRMCYIMVLEIILRRESSNQDGIIRSRYECNSVESKLGHERLVFT